MTTNRGHRINKCKDNFHSFVFLRQKLDVKGEKNLTDINIPLWGDGIRSEHPGFRENQFPGG